MNLLIHNITIFSNDDQNTILKNHAVVVEGSMIKEIGSESELPKKYPGFKHIDGAGRLLMPGLINAHMHFYSTFARGLALRETPQNFHQILQMLWWKLDSSLDSDAVYYSALVPAITAIKKGVTAVIDHHASPNAVDGSLDRIEEALSQVGMRGILCYEVTDRDGKEICQKGLRENKRYIQKCRAEKQKNPAYPFDAMMGLHASFTLDDDTLQQAAELSRSLQQGCHIHVLEDAVDRRITKDKYGSEIISQKTNTAVRLLKDWNVSASWEKRVLPPMEFTLARQKRTSSPIPTPLWRIIPSPT
jgi:cytosine/adenosine deaminase-related metal-dependent hydrolase